MIQPQSRHVRLLHVSGYFKQTSSGIYSNIRLHGLALPTLMMKQDRSGNGARSSSWSNSSPVAELPGLTVRGEVRQTGRCFQICSLKNVPRTASTPSGWCPSRVREVRKS